MYKNKKTVIAACFTILVSACLFTELVLRFFLYRDYGKLSLVADALPNFAAVLLVSLGYSIIKGMGTDSSPFKISLLGTSTIIIYELAQYFIRNINFNWFDIFASISGGIFVFLLLYVIGRCIH